MKTIIFSGFGTFPTGNYRANSTELLAQRLENQTLADYRIVSTVFPCTLCVPDEDRARELLTLARKECACGIIATGMSSALRGFAIETTGRNEIRNTKYCESSRIGTRFVRDFALGHVFDLPITEWRPLHFREACKEAGIPTTYSYNAGGYCCEELIVQMYRVQYALNLRSLPFIFLHMPCCPEAVADEATHRKEGKITMPLHTMELGISLLLQTAQL